MAVGATAVWRVRPSGSNTNGGGYDSGISGAATDYSQQNSAQATGTLGTSTASTTFTDAGGAFTAAMVGNALWIASGAGFTTGAYFITGYTNSTTITLDRASGTGTAAHWAVGGGWADFTNIQTPITGNVVFLLGSGTPNPASYVYDYTLSTNIPQPTNTITIANDPATPGYLAPPNTTGGMPVVKCNNTNGVIIYNGNGVGLTIKGVWFVATSNQAGTAIIINLFNRANPPIVAIGCVFDQFGIDCGFMTAQNSDTVAVGCEVFSSVTPGSAGTFQTMLVQTSPASLVVESCNIHDAVGYGIASGANGAFELFISNCIIAKCLVDGINVYTTSVSSIKNNTIDGNLGNGITLNAAATDIIFNNIISNHTQTGKSGVDVVSGLPTAFFDYNVYYNNTTNITGASYGPHDTALGVTPYVASSTENYTLV